MLGLRGSISKKFGVCFTGSRTICAAYDGPRRRLGDMSQVLRDLASPESLEKLEKGEIVKACKLQKQYGHKNKWILLRKMTSCASRWS